MWEWGVPDRNGWAQERRWHQVHSVGRGVQKAKGEHIMIAINAGKITGVQRCSHNVPGK